jgi:hypothetical protein
VRKIITNTNYISVDGTIAIFNEDEELDKGGCVNIIVTFTNDILGETISLTAGTVQLQVPFEPVQALIDKTRNAKNNAPSGAHERCTRNI